MADDRADKLLRKSFQEIQQLRAALQEAKAASSEPIAIIGMACQVPGGITDPEGYWALLDQGRDAIQPFPARWRPESVYDPDPDAVGKSYVREGGFLHDVDLLDAGFFGIAPREAVQMDPQQRLILETSWEALERAGIVPSSLHESRTGVYVGAMGSDYGLHEFALENLDGYRTTGVIGSVLSGRISYVLGLQGPSMTIDTACSSSLVALHLACAGLRQGDCTLALAGGVLVMSTTSTFVEFSRLRALSPDGRCRSFASQADGTSWAEGCGMLVLKRLRDAERDGDRVLAVVRGTAVNQDGRSQGLTAPNGPSQQRVIRQALEVSGLTPDDIDAIEAHGTGTRLGDPIEAGALAEVFGPTRADDRPVWLGSAKSNFGHSQAAAGVLGLIKMVLALQHQRLPRTLHAETPTEQIDWTTSGLSLLQVAQPWPHNPGRVRRAGVSSFGISGTNAHVIVEEAPPLPAPPSGAPGVPIPLLVSGWDESALRAQAGHWAAWLRAHPEVSWSHVLRTAALHRTHFSSRASLAVTEPQEAIDALQALADGQPHAAIVQAQARERKGVVFVFSGHGSQWPGMGRALLQDSSAFAQAIDACDRALRPHTDWSVRAVLQGGRDELLERVEVLQPVLFAMGVGLAAAWRSLGVEPVAVVGHSVGEIAAAVVSGALSLEDGARVVALRGRLIARGTREGGMLYVQRPEAEVAARIAPWSDSLSIAVVNDADAAVVSGELTSILALQTRLEREGVFCRRVKAGFAAHSRHMDEVLEAFRAAISDLRPNPTALPFYSTVLGDRLDGTALDAGYWCRNIREVVRFDRAMTALLANGHDVFLEIGAHPVLGIPMTSACAQRAGVVVASLMRDAGGVLALLRNLGALHAAGSAVDWHALLGAGPRAVVPLPTYPFQRQKYWLTLPSYQRNDAEAPFWNAVAAQDAERVSQLLKLPGDLSTHLRPLIPHLADWHAGAGRQERLSRWLYSVAWESVPAPRVASRNGPILWIYPEATGWEEWADRLHASATAAGRASTVMGLSDYFAHQERTSGGHRQSTPDVVLLSAIGDNMQKSLMAVVGTIQKALQLEDARLWIMTRGALAVHTGDVVERPWDHMVWGLGRTVGLEHASQWGGLIDLPSLATDKDADTVLAVLSSPGDEDDELAVRGSRLLGRRLRRRPSGRPEKDWRTSGTALVTGGTGALGRHVARWLATHGAEHLVLTSRQGPAAPHAMEAAAELLALGATVEIVACDVAQRDEVEALLSAIAPGDRKPIRTIVHAAGVGDERPFELLDERYVGRVLAGKVNGARWLNELIADAPLDAFVLYGSISDLWGAPGFAAYAAANAALVGLAEHRRALGRPATAIYWGPWADGGMLGDELSASLRSQGLPPMMPTHALEALGQVLAESPDSDVAVVDVDWARFAPSFGLRATRRKLFLGTAEARDALRTSQGAVAGSGVEAANDAPSLRQLDPDALGREVHARVVDALRSVLGLDAGKEIALSISPLELGLDSIMGVQLAGTLRARLGVQIPAASLLQASAVQEILDAVHHRLSPASDDAEDLRGVQTLRPVSRGGSGSWLVPIQQLARPAVRLICFAYAGGGAAVYSSWRGRLPEEVEVLAVELPGRGRRFGQPGVQNLAEIAHAVRDALRERPVLPLMVFGHCLGAIAAFEFCRVWLAEGGELRHLFASGAPAPHLYTAADVTELTDAQLIDIMEDIGLAGLQAMRQDAEFMNVAMQIMRADMRLAGEYDLPRGARRPLPLTAFSAGADNFAPTCAVEAWREYADRPAEFKHYQYSGGHYFIEGEREAILGVVTEVIQADRAASSAVLRTSHELPQRGRPALVLLAGGVSSAADFDPVVKAVERDLDVLVLEPPRHGTRAGLPLRRLEPLAALLEEELASITSPLILFGHFFSAHVCLEIARRRMARGLPVQHLIVSGSMAPARYFMPPWRLPKSERLLARDIREQLRKDPSSTASMDAQLSAAFHHHPGTGLDQCIDIPVTAIAARGDDMVPAASIPPWARVTRGPFDFHRVEGGHLYYVSRPEILSRILADIGRQLVD